MLINLRQISWIIAVTLYLSLAIPTPGRAGSGSWEVWYETTRLTDAASPLPVGPAVLLDVTSIGPVLGISVFPEDSGFSLQAADGRRWRWEVGSAYLSSGSEVMPLTIPPIQQGISVLLSADAIAELSGLQLSMDAVSKQLIFGNPGLAEPETPAQEDIGDGWQVFTITKPRPAEPLTRPGARRRQANLTAPPSRDRFDVGVGLGYVQDVDWGMELTASGKVWGGETSFWGLLTRNDRSTRLKNSHLIWLDREGGRGVEAGDLYAETWGLVRGVRYSWDAGGNRWPSLGFYLKTDRTDNEEALVAYRDRLAIGRNFYVRGEVGSDESTYANAVYKRRGFEFFAFRRHLPDDRGKNEGVFASCAIFPQVSLFYGTSSSTDSEGRDSRLETVGMRLPLLKRCSLILQQTENDNEHHSWTMRSVGLTVPLARSIHLFLRYQKNSSDVDVFAGRLINLHSDTTSLLTSLSLFANKRLYLNYQRSRYSQGRQTSYFEQLITNYRLSPRTSLQMVSGFPNIADSDLLRLRLNHQLGDNVSLLVDYGRLAPYQSAKDLFGKRGFMVMLRKTWPLRVPARGGAVSGAVTDQLAQPIENITVQLGPYTAMTDKDGKYSFDYVPTGTYSIRIPDESIPADYKVGSAMHEAKVRRGSRQTFNFSLTPLGSITGHVYLDRDGDGKYDRGEGIADVAVCANDFATATNKDGIFTFYNLEPGSYVIMVATEVLDRRYTLRRDGQIKVELQPQGSVAGIEFQLEERKKPIIFTTLD